MFIHEKINFLIATSGANAKFLPKNYFGTRHRKQSLRVSRTRKSTGLSWRHGENFYRFLSQNIKYPADAVKNDIQGNVFLSFTVEKSGAIADLKIDRKLGYGTDEEALRVIKLAGMWNPGTIEGKAVAVKYNIPVKFTLNKKTSAKPATGNGK
ncbi:MAG: energy transducer TonB [Flavobacteriales bacterium]|nr:MAG: energy transducer TonB [Flavobacteriales bacterium]